MCKLLIFNLLFFLYNRTSYWLVRVTITLTHIPKHDSNKEIFILQIKNKQRKYVNKLLNCIYTLKSYISQ